MGWHAFPTRESLFGALHISVAESNALFMELGEYPRRVPTPKRGPYILRFAAALILVFVASTSAVSSLDAPHAQAAGQVEPGRAPQILVAFTSGEATIAGIALIP
jgi:hypothetical protein